MIQQYAKLIIGFPKSVLIVVMFLTIYIGLGISKLQTRNNYDSDLPKDDPIIITNDRLEEVFGEKDVILIGIKADNIFNQQTLRKIALISEELKQVEGVVEDQIISLSTLNNIKGRDWGLDVGPFMGDVPETDEEIDRIRQDVMTNNLIYGKLVSKDLSSTIITANIERGYDQATVYNQVRKITEKYNGPERLYINGEPIIQQEIDLGIQRDISVLLPFALILVLIGFFLSFRNLRGVFLPFIVVVLSIVWTMGIMGWVGLEMTVVSSALPMVMVAVASSYGIHIVHRYYEEIRHKSVAVAVRETIVAMTPPVAMTGITSAAGSATLAVFKVVSIREFGIIAAIGILSALFLTLSVPPALLMLLKKPVRKHKKIRNSFIDRVLMSLGRFTLDKPGIVLIVTLIIIGFSIVGITRIRIGSDITEMFPKKHSIRQSFDMFNDYLGGARYFNVMISGKKPNTITNPALLRQIEDFQRYAEKLEGVGYTNSFADIIKRIHRVMNSDNLEFERIPDSEALIAQYLLLYSMSGDPGDFEDIVDYDYQRAKIRIMIRTSDQDDHKRLYRDLRHYAKTHFDQGVEIEFAGSVMSWLARIQYIVRGEIQNIIMAIVIIFLFCLIVFRSLSGGLLSIVPLSIATMITFGLMGFIGIRLEMGTSIITAIAVGVGVDFAIHFVSRFKEEFPKTGDTEKATVTTLTTTGKAIIFDMFSNILGFSVLIFSGFTPVQNFGWLVSLTMITSGFGSLVILPPLFAAFKPRFIWGKGKTKTTRIGSGVSVQTIPVYVKENDHYKK
ncbi:MAG: RND family transporter [FCB group bacterium]|nr:RND family transporter [FCB group bacterium]